MLYNCPKGHSSTDSDFCSVCGTRINSSLGSSVAVSNSTSSNTTVPCPDCGTIHEISEGKFCEICGHNFETGQSGGLPMDLPPIVIPPLDIPTIKNIPQPITSISPPTADCPPPPVQTAATWTVTVIIDPTIASAESPPAPTTQPDRTFKLQPGTTNLIGRNSAARAIAPEIALDSDTAVSTRHALLDAQIDGQLILRDIGSSNGTQLNGIDLVPMKDYPLKPSDRITIGHWTAIVIN
jgi:hypothetical protein